MMMDDMLDMLLQTPGPRGRTGLPAVLTGPPGTAKTATVEHAARRHGLHVETIILSIRDPSDIAGLPIPGPDGVRLEPPQWARRLASLGQGLLFVDELSCASPSLQAAILRVFTEGYVGDLALPPGIRFLAAANPEDQAAGGFAFSAPLANRLLHVTWPEPDATAWATWLTAGANGIHDAGPVRTLDSAAWDRAWRETRAGVAALLSRAHLPGVALLALPRDDTARGGAWSSPRSWELATRALAGARALGLGDGACLDALASAVGQGTAAAAWEYLSHLDLPDPLAILAGQATVPLDRLDRAYASLSSAIDVAMHAPPDAPETRVRALEVAHTVAERYADVAFACATPLFSSLGAIAARFAKRLAPVLGGPLGALRKELVK